MKRFISLILILMMLISATHAAAENSHCRIEAQIHAGDQEILASLNIYSDDNKIYFTSSLFPDVCIQLSGVDSDEIIQATLELIRNMSDERMAEVILQSVKEWSAFMQPETRKGSFSGDAFDCATSMEHIVFSYGDLMLLEQRTVNALRMQGLSGALLESDWSSAMMPERNIRFDLKAFDEGRYASLNVLDGEEIIMTVSANLSDPDSALLVIGRGFGGKNYYSRILAEKKENRLEISEMLYADDLKNGFPGLGRDNLICTRTFTVSMAEEDGQTKNVQISGSLLPANDLSAIRFAGMIYNAEAGRIFDGEIWFPGDNQLSIMINAELDHDTIGEMPARVVDLDQADEKELVALGTEIGVALLPIFYQILSALPAEYVDPVMKLMN